MKKLPIRLRLASWYFAVFAAAQLAFGIAMFLALRHSLYAIVDENLAERIESVRRFIDTQKKDADLAKMREEVTETYEIEPEGRYLRVFTDSGDLVFESKHLAQADLPPVSRIGGEQPFYTNLFIAGRPFRFQCQRVQAHGGVYVIQIGVSISQTTEALVRFVWGLVLVAPTLFLAASLAGYWISRRALAPVDAITTQARVIGERSLSTRLPDLGTYDELQRLSDTLNEMLERIESSFRRVTRFTADASHELRTPVSLIRIESELALRKDRRREEYRDALQNILIQSEKTGELLENLLALTRADAGRETLVFVDLDLCPSVEAVGLWWQNAAKTKSIRLAVELPNDKIWIQGDRSALERLLAILLDNAVKYTPVGGDIVVSLARGRETTELKVRDTGIGIAPEHQPRVFERFYRVDDSRNKNTGGSGLGLAIAEWIVKQHRGSIVVESKLERGSTFTVRLPIARSILDAAGQSERLPVGVNGSAQAKAPSDPTRSGFV